MKILKAVSAVTLAAILGITGCGTATSSGNNSSSASSSQKPSSVTIGAVLPLTGQGAMYGTMGRDGMTLAQDEINSAGGVDGIKINIQFEDHQSEATLGVTALRQLSSIYHVPYSLVSYSNVIPAQLPIANQNHITLMNGFAQDDTLAGASPYLFNDIPLAGLEVPSLLNYLVKVKGFTKVGIVYDNAGLGLDLYNQIKSQISSVGGTIVDAESGALGSTSWQPQLTKVKSANPQVIIIGTYGQDTVDLLTQAKQIGVSTPFAATSVAMIPAVYGLPESQGLIHTSLQMSPSGEFIDNYQKKFNTQPTVYSITSYNSVEIFAKALDYVVKHNEKINGDSIKNAITALKKFDTPVGTISFDAKGTSSVPVTLNQVENGKDTPLQK